jgi:hypothetical protein
MSYQTGKPSRGFVAFIRRRTIPTDIVQGVIVGAVLAFVGVTIAITLQSGAMQSTANGWSTTQQCGEPGNNILEQAACAKTLPAANLKQEAVYWTATVNGAGQTLSGQHDYVLHFPAGELPPNHAFWSITMTNAKRLMVANSINRYSLGDRSGLIANSDGSLDIYIQALAPSGHEANWLPAPKGDFMLWLRAYQPAASVLDGKYRVPAVKETK